MATPTTSALTTSPISTTYTRKRTVADKIRRLFPSDASLLALVSNGMNAGSDIVREKGLIAKKRVENRKFEGYTYTPITLTFTVSTAGTTSIVVSSASGLTLKTVLVNTANMTVARVSGINSTTLTMTSVGSTAFSAAVGDVLMSMGPAYEENSSNPYLLMQEEDNYYNTTHIFRFPAAISRTAKKLPHHGSPDYWSRVKKNVLTEGLRRVEIAMLFGERPSSGETTTDSTLSDTFGTFRGLWNWAASSYDGGGNMTWENFVIDLPDAMHESVGSQEKVIMLCGYQTHGRMIRWAMDKLIEQRSGTLDKFGVKTSKFVTAKWEIDVLVHDAFNRGSLTKSALVFMPERVQYCHYFDDDLKPKLGIQDNSVDGVEDDILGELSLWSEDAGYSVLKCTNLW